MKLSPNGIASFKLPHGRFVSLWVATDLRVTPWTFFWADPEFPKLPKMWYRAFPARKTPGDWKAMKPGWDVLKQTGFDNDPDVLVESDEGAPIGAAEKLPRGRYLLQARLRVAGKYVELGDVPFTVK
jgi:hypothetical protein